MSEINNTYGSFDKALGETAIAAANEIASLKTDLEKWSGEAVRLTQLAEDRGAEISNLTRERDNYQRSLNELRESWNRAVKLFEASLEEDGVDTDDLNENTRALVELFEIEFTREVEVRVTVTYSGTVTVPKNADIYNIEGGLDYYDSLDLELEGNNVGSISYDDFDIEEI
jgi:predicted  nucleic acid-binding Zn-ribbon protein